MIHHTLLKKEIITLKYSIEDLRSWFFLLFLVKGQESNSWYFYNFEFHTWNITNWASLSTKTCNKYFIILFNKIQTPIIWNKSCYLFGILDQLNTNTFTDSRVWLFWFNATKIRVLVRWKYSINDIVRFQLSDDYITIWYQMSLSGVLIREDIMMKILTFFPKQFPLHGKHLQMDCVWRLFQVLVSCMFCRPIFGLFCEFLAFLPHVNQLICLEI